MRRFVALLTLVGFWLPSAVVGQEKRPDFAHDVVPVLRARCVECHGGEQAEGGFSLNTRASVLESEAAVPGKPDRSRLFELITSGDPDDQMPPKDKPRLGQREIEVLKAWIADGLPWEQGFTFAARRYRPPLLPRRPDLPGDDDEAHPIDRIVDAYMAEHGVTPPPPLEDAAFVRRVGYDVLGLPPGAIETAWSPRADGALDRERLIDRLLARDREYAEHWMTFWNDLLRNTYSGTGFIDDGRRQITAWLYRSLLENKPYDRFVRELIAPTAESEGFIRGIKWRGNVNASQSREIQFAQSVCQTLLGINMKCASCHDSFIDDWKLDQAYSLAAVYSTRSLEIHRCDKPTGRTAEAAWIFPELGKIDPAAEQPERLEQLAGLMTHPDNGRLTRTIVNRIWHRLMGRGIVHPVDAMHARPWSEDLLDYLAVHLVDHDYDLKSVMRLILTSRAYQSRAVVVAEETTGEFVFRGPVVKRLTAEQFLDTIFVLTERWPAPDANAMRMDGRKQGGQLAAVLKAHDQDQWGDRRLRAVFTPLDSLQATLGRPNREQIVTSRPSQFTTLEAISLANGPRLAELLERGAESILSRFEDDPGRVTEYLYEGALAREPTPEERAVARSVMGDPPTGQGTADLMWTVLMLPEFHFLR